MQSKWTFTALLLIVYLGVFHLWMNLRPEWVIGTGLVAVAMLSALFIAAARQQYFVNVWDGIFHAAVILDLLLESVLIRGHEHLGFYLCTAAFAAVLVGYRSWCFSKLRLN